MNANKDICDELNDGNHGYKNPGRRGRPRPEEPWFEVLTFQTRLMNMTSP